MSSERKSVHVAPSSAKDLDLDLDLIYFIARDSMGHNGRQIQELIEMQVGFWQFKSYSDSKAGCVTVKSNFPVSSRQRCYQQAEVNTNQNQNKTVNGRLRERKG